MNKYLILIAGSIGTFLIDQYTKRRVLANFDLRESVSIIDGHFALTYVQNRGAAFGIFADFGRLFFLTISLVAIAFILYFFWKIRPEQRIMSVALSLIFGGAVGNLYDRAFRGFVVDFIEFTFYGGYQWPTFNVADIAICVGVGILVLELLSQKRELPCVESYDESS